MEDNLAERFGKDESPEFAVGVLHTNVGGSPGHENYASCRMEDLLGKGMDYWALGHIHNKRILRDYNPAIVYCGNSQARSFREKGERGCYLVTLHKGAPPDIRFVATDAIRYHSANLDLSNASSIEDILQTVQSTCGKISAQMESRDVLLRLNLTGRSPIHSELRRPGTLEGLMEEIHEYFEGRNPAVWVDLKLQTQPQPRSVNAVFNFLALKRPEHLQFVQGEGKNIPIQLLRGIAQKGIEGFLTFGLAGIHQNRHVSVTPPRKSAR